MKNLHFILLALIISSSSILNSQISVIDNQNEIKIGEVTQVGLPIISCSKVENEYTFNYINNIDLSKRSNTSFKLIDLDGDFEQLYALILKGFKEKKNSIVKIQTDDEVIGLEFIRSFGITAFRFLQYDNDETVGYSIALSRRQVNKLFGR